MEPTERFSDRVDDYVRYRPGYPPEALEPLSRDCGLGPGATVADVGAGTGIWTRRLLDTGCRVLALEPNERDAAARPAAARRASARLSWLGGHRRGHRPAPDGSVDLVTAAQAFHWFDRPRARVELGTDPGAGRLDGGDLERAAQGVDALPGRLRAATAGLGDRLRADRPHQDRPPRARPFFAPHAAARVRLRQPPEPRPRGSRGPATVLLLRPRPRAPAPRADDGRAAPDLRRPREDGRVAMDYDCRVYYGRLD